MKLNWLVTVALGVVLAGCGPVDPQSTADSEQDAPELTAEIISMPEVSPGQEDERVSAMVTCKQYRYENGACGCDAGSSCGYTRITSVRYGECQPGCTSCYWDAWIETGTSCVASSACTFC